MLIRRIKKFTDREDSHISPPPFLPYRKDVPVKLDIKSTKEFEKEWASRSTQSREWTKEAKRVRNSIKSGYIYSDGNPSEHTHYYKDESTGTMYYVSKDINSNDGLMYSIYAPEPIFDENNNLTEFIIKIRLLFCTGHTHRNGKKFSQN